MPIRNIIREVPPEQCEFSYYFDDDGIREAGGDFCYNLFIITRERWNRISGFQADEYKRIVQELDYIAEEFEALRDGDSAYKSYKEIMHDYRISYTPNRCHALKELIFGMDDTSDPETVAAYLTIKTGREWDTVSATGYCQGDFCTVVYCKDFHKEPLAYGEIWLGAGREFCVIDLDDDGNEIDTCYGFIVADCQAWKDEDYKRLVCEWDGLNPEETELQMIENAWTRTEYEYRTA